MYPAVGTAASIYIKTVLNESHDSLDKNITATCETLPYTWDSTNDYTPKVY